MDLVNCDAILGTILFVILGGTLGEFWDMTIFLDAFDLDILCTFQSCEPLDRSSLDLVLQKVRDAVSVINYVLHN